MGWYPSCNRPQSNPARCIHTTNKRKERANPNFVFPNESIRPCGARAALYAGSFANPAWATTYRTTFESLLTLSESAIMEHIKLRDAAEDADAQLDQLDSELDEFALYLFKFMMAETTGHRSRHAAASALWNGKAESFCPPAAGGTSWPRMRNWPTVLNGAPLAKLVAVGKDVDALIKRCDSALSAMRRQRPTCKRLSLIPGRRLSPK